jgi:hypothetical protein
MNYGLGRLQFHDERDKLFPLQAVLPPAKADITDRNWYQNGWWGNQLQTPQCVAFAWAHWLEDGPVTHKEIPPPMIAPTVIYGEAQQNDEWEGTSYEGTSVRGGAKALQARGWIKEYRWTTNVEELAQAILTTGPAVVGTNWYQNMFMLAKGGFLKPGGQLVGGHAWVINGVDTKTQRFRIKNSWGRDWGRQGNAFITFEDMQRLLNEDGECCLAIENKKQTSQVL